MTEVGTRGRVLNGDSFPYSNCFRRSAPHPVMCPALGPWTRGKSYRTRSSDACLSDRCPRLHRGEIARSKKKKEEAMMKTEGLHEVVGAYGLGILKSNGYV